MKAIIVLAAVSAILTGCGKSGDNSGLSVGAQSVDGTYAMKTTRANGDVVVIFAEIFDGRIVISNYKFVGGNMSMASYLQWDSSDVVTGNTHNITLTRATCPTLNGVTGPTTQAFPITPLDDNKILLHSNAANADFMMDKVDSVPQALADMGTYLLTEVTDCTAAF